MPETDPAVRQCPHCDAPLAPRRRICDDCRDSRQLASDKAHKAGKRAKEVEARRAVPVKKHSGDAVQRLAALMGLLRASRGRVVLTAEIRDRLPAYAGEGDTVRRLLRGDLAFLKARGMVRTEITYTYAVDRDGVEYLEVVKPAEYELTAAEHAAIGAARKALRPGPIPGALPPVRDHTDDDPNGGDGDDLPSGTARDLDLLMRLLRAVEEHAGPLPVDDLCVLVGADRPAVIGLLRQADELGGLDAQGGDLFSGFHIEYDDAVDDDDAVQRGDDIVHVQIVPPAFRRRNPTTDIGLDELGRFGYTDAECADRLGLLDEALDEGWAESESPELVEALETARWKLEAWRGYLAIQSRAGG